MNSGYIILYLMAVMIASFSQIILKTSANKKYTRRLYEILNLYVLVAYSLFVLSMMMATLALKGMSYKYGAVMEGIGYLCVLVLSVVLLKEKVTKYRLLGNLIIVVGIIIFSL